MPVKPPSRLFRVDYVDVVRVERDGLMEPQIQYRDKEVIKEIEKVVFKDDPKLLEQYNKVLKENGDLKQRLEEKPKMISVENVNTNFKEKVVVVEKFITNLKREIIIGVSSFGAGSLLCYLLLR